MNPAERDAIIRIFHGTDWPQMKGHLQNLRQATANTLTTIDPTDVINIARVQGRISTYDAVLDLGTQAALLLERKEEDNG